MDNNNIIMERLGEISGNVVELVRRVGLQNGRIGKSEEKINDLMVKYQNIADNDNFIVKIVDSSYKKIEKFIDEKEKKSERWKNINSSIIIFIITSILGFFLGSLFKTLLNIIHL